MQLRVVLLALVMAAGIGQAQRYKIGEVNAEKPEGQLLQQILQEADAAKKTALMEQFVTEYPKHEAYGFILEQLQGAYVKAGATDKIVETGQKLVALDADDIEASLQILKAIEPKKDPEQIKKWTAATAAAARKATASPQPKEADEVEHWKSTVDYAKQVSAYTDYALYRAALEATDPKVKIDLAETMLKHNPQSEYNKQLQNPLFLAYRQAGANDKAVALAEKVLATDQTNEDMLIVVADDYMQKKKDLEKVHAYSAKVVEVLAAKPKPEGVSDADWQNRNKLLVGLAHYMKGKLYYGESKFAPADKELRAALPLVENNANMKPEVLYLLAFANYKLDKPQEAADYYKACGAIKSPYQALANKNLLGLKQQFRGLK